MKAFLYLLVLLSISCQQKKDLNGMALINAIKENDEQLSTPKPGEWLYEHHEPGQTFTQYKAEHPVTPNKTQNKIYLQPIGNFSDQQKKIVEYTADYLHLYFNLPTEVSSPISDKIIPDSARRTREDGSIQLLATFILDSLLKKHIPKDAIVVMAITEKDLFPKPSWGFVFGLASLQERVGVSSIYRYSKQPLDSTNYSTCLGRLISTSSHEIGHMFSMRHCIHAICIMNGSNSLSESDSKPNRVCSECLHKLYWNLKFDNKKRLLNLLSFFAKHHLKRDYALLEKDLALLD